MDTLVKLNFAETVQDIVENLGGNWRVENIHSTDYNSSATIYNESVSLWIVANCYGLKDKFRIRGNYAKIDNRIVELWDEEQDDSMQCTTKKTGAQIAKDITKRILPSVEHNTKLVNEKVENHFSAQTGLQCMKQEFKDIGMNRENMDNVKSNNVEHYDYSKGQDFEIHLGHKGESVYYMKINKLTVKQSQEMAKLVLTFTTED